jgi:signal transduction histidine kinase
MLEPHAEAGDLIATVVHDLKNPLNAILMSATLIGRATRDESINRQVAVIRRSAERMNRLILELLDQAALDAGRLPIRRARHEVPALFREASELTQSVAAAKGVQIVLVPCEHCWVDCDGERIQQILSNLLGNALAYTPPGGRIELGARAVASGTVELFVRDDGPGIPAEEMPHVFERFWRGRGAARANAGLGLSIAKGIVEAHGGGISVDSVPGRGTTFHFTLPGGLDERAEASP